MIMSQGGVLHKDVKSCPEVYPMYTVQRIELIRNTNCDEMEV